MDLTGLPSNPPVPLHSMAWGLRVPSLNGGSGARGHSCGEGEGQGVEQEIGGNPVPTSPETGGRTAGWKKEAGLRPLQSPEPSGFVFIRRRPRAQPSPREVAEPGE